MDNLTEAHYPKVIDDGIQFRAFCSCGWKGPSWRNHRNTAEYDWGEHGVKTIKRNFARRSFSIIGNPLAKKESN